MIDIFDLPMSEIKERNADLERLIAIADLMFAEHAAKVQAASDAEYMKEFGHTGPSIASPLDSAGREYVYWRHQLGRKHGLPDAMTALGQRNTGGTHVSSY